MSVLANHPGFVLRDDAAAAFNRAEADHGVLSVNRAGVSEAAQQELIDRWNAGGAANRPPFLYQPAMPASASNHVKQIAVDIANYSKFAAYCTDYGFYHDIASDPVHFDFKGVSGAPVVRNSDTMNRQAFLNTQGWNLAVDGVQGPLTTQAYREYQQQLKNKGLYAGAIDGIWGPQTEAAHAANVASLTPPAPAPATTGPLSYAAIQAALNKFGYGLAVDNVWGPKSHAALGQFQASHGLAVDYLVGPLTRAQLGI